jgi:3-oxoadipate enol-lactonase
MPLSRTGEAKIYYQFDSTPHPSTLVLSNSLGTDISLWDGQAPEILKHFSLLRYDLRGHGRSPLPAGPYSIEQLSRDVLSLLDELGLRQVHFGGISMGGMVGQWLGVHAPERVKSLVLSNTAAQCGEPAFWNQWIELARQQGMEGLIPSILQDWYSASYRTAHPEVIARTTEMLRKTNPEGFAACCVGIRDMDQRPDVGKIRVPTLVVFGKHDQATPPIAARFLIENIPGAEELELPAAHLSCVEAESAFTKGVVDFLLRHDA